MEAKPNRKTKRIYCSLISVNKRLSEGRAPKTDYSSRLSYDLEQNNRRISAADNSLKLIQEKAKKIFELSPKNLLTEKSLQFLVELIDANFSTRLLMEILMVKWSDKDMIISGKIQQCYSKDLQKNEETKELPQTGRLNYYNQQKCEGTLLQSIFDCMNNSRNKRLRKFSSYFLCYFSFNNSIVQNKLCEGFGFSPLSSAVILNNFPKNLNKSTDKRKSNKNSKLMIINLMKLLKNNCEHQYSQYIEVKPKQKKLLFFCYPEFKSNLASLNDFPDPWEYLIGFFVSQKTKSEQEIPLMVSVSSKQNYSSFDQTYEKVESPKDSMNVKLPKNSPKTYVSSKITEENKSQSSKTARNNVYKLKPPNQRINLSNNSRKEEKNRKKYKKNLARSQLKYSTNQPTSKKQVDKGLSITSRLSKDFQNRPVHRYSKLSKSLLKPEQKRTPIIKAEVDQSVKPEKFRASEYYYQITNNINLSVDINKKYTTRTVFSDRHHSINSDLSKPSESEMVRRINQKKRKLQTKRDIDTAKKTASKHISIVLKHNKPNLRQEFDIQLTHDQEKEENSPKFKKMHRNTKKKKKSMSPRGLKNSLAKYSEKKSFHSDKKKINMHSPGAIYSPKGDNNHEKKQEVGRKKFLGSYSPKCNNPSTTGIFDINEMSEPLHHNPPRTLLSKPKMETNSLQLSLTRIDKNLAKLNTTSPNFYNSKNSQKSSKPRKLQKFENPNRRLSGVNSNIQSSNSYMTSLKTWKSGSLGSKLISPHQFQGAKNTKVSQFLIQSDRMEATQESISEKSAVIPQNQVPLTMKKKLPSNLPMTRKILDRNHD
ncbi:unnamed protein product [Moneuplotes crassus]|uniref:Uncharacterized protein n=1 Tax=Euplotes crassus TaxID=5936 RepID=A0AAD1XUW3_EUPCR|nr:unnamed protein product [Moneuplotes crassus]